MSQNITQNNIKIMEKKYHQCQDDQYLIQWCGSQNALMLR